MGGDWLTWIGVLVCLSQSATFSGLNLAMFSLNPLRLEVEAELGSEDARRVLPLRKDANLALATVLIGNVAVNVLLTLLSNSLMAGVTAFFFSTVVITAFGEILPQAYFTRHALPVVAALSPLFRFYRALLYPITKPVALLLDRWPGDQSFPYLMEDEFRELLTRYIEAKEAEIGAMEGLGAINFLKSDDLPLSQLGEPVDPLSIVRLPFAGPEPHFPDYAPDPDDAFLRSVNASGRKWVIVTNMEDRPRLVLDADGFLRDALMGVGRPNPMAYCHAPIIVLNGDENLGAVLGEWQVHMEHESDHVIDRDVILVWGRLRRIITGADVLGRLLMGIAKRLPPEGGPQG